MAEKSRLVKPENTLKKKVGNGGFDEKILVNAQKVIEENTIDFKPMALDFLNQLDGIFVDIKEEKIDENAAHDQIMYPLMQLKAQGALFHYPLITKISYIVVDFLENVSGVDKDALEIVKAYKQSIFAVLSLKIQTDDNKIGKELCDALVDACNRYYKAKGKA